MQLAAIPQVLPFGLVLASVALGPSLWPRVWRRYQIVILGGLSAVAVFAVAMHTGPSAAVTQAGDALWHQWMPFTALLLALYATGGGILIAGGPWGHPLGNTALLAIGTALAGVVGTTGAVLAVVHPLLRANIHRRYRAHLMIFLILLAGNVGGASTPLGDPPLMAGFFHGVPFLWPARVLGPKTLAMAVILLGIFFVTDSWLGRGELPPRRTPLRLRGLSNVALAFGTVAVVILYGAARGLVVLPFVVAWLVIALISFWITPEGIRVRNRFSWAPMVEVLAFFAAVFVTLQPVFDHLSMPAGLASALDTKGLYWTTGLLSAIIDNTPTYLVFSHLGGATPASLAAAGDSRLAAIAAGAVYFGGLTYVGNAPNLIVRAIADHGGVRMPGFFQYAVIAGCAMAPGLVLIGWWLAY